MLDISQEKLFTRRASLAWGDSGKAPQLDLGLFNYERQSISSANDVALHSTNLPAVVNGTRTP